MFLLWEHAVLSLFNYIVFVWLFLLVVLWLPLPDRPVKHTLNMAGFKVRRETRTAAPDWLDAVQARVTRDMHSSCHGPAPAPRPPPHPRSCSSNRYRSSSEHNRHALKHLCILLFLIPLNPPGKTASPFTPRSPSRPVSIAPVTFTPVPIPPHLYRTHHFHTGPHPVPSPS